MIIIADSGSTKTIWCSIGEHGQKGYFTTEGYNPYFVDVAYIIQSMQSSMPSEIVTDKVTAIFFYGSGCFPDKENIIVESMKSIFKQAKINVYLDLLGAARSLLANDSGFVAILGTGTNTCLFKEGKIVQNIDSLGYLLGDEGSGCFIGKKLLGDYLRGYLPVELSELFFSKYQFTSSSLMDNIYGKPLANRFCAGFSIFVGENINHPYMMNLVSSSFDLFFENLVSKYDDYQKFTFNCVGTVGYVFKNLLENSCHKFNMSFGHIIKSPIDGLVSFHTIN